MPTIVVSSVKGHITSVCIYLHPYLCTRAWLALLRLTFANETGYPMPRSLTAGRDEVFLFCEDR